MLSRSFATKVNRDPGKEMDAQLRCPTRMTSVADRHGEGHLLGCFLNSDGLLDKS